MRLPDLGVLPGAIEQFSAHQTLKMFERACRIRAFEWGVKLAHDQRKSDGSKHIQMPIYLSMGQEFVASSVAESFLSKVQPALFGQHRCHDIYLAFGGRPEGLRDELLHKDTGCAGGMGGSASIHSPPIKMFGTDGFIGTNVAIGTGYAYATREPTIIFFGDAAAEEGWALESFGWAAFQKLPILFICVDNNMSVLTEVDVRRNWNVVDVAKGFGIEQSFDLADDPWTIMNRVRMIDLSCPALFNIHTVRHWWHNGTGCDGPPEWDRMTIVKKVLDRAGLFVQAHKLEREVNFDVEQLWLEAIPDLDLTEWRDNR